MVAPVMLYATCRVVLTTTSNAIIELDIFAHETNYTISFSSVNLQVRSRHEP